MTAIDPQRMRTALPQVLETIRTYAGLDPTRDMVPVKPTAHYTMGGIPITTEGEVYRWQGGERRIVDGLYAAGECSCVGVHGANRLGGNSLLDACLFGGRAGAAMAARIETATSPADDGVDPVYDAAERRRSQVAAWLQDHDASGDETMSAPSTSNASDEDNESNKSDESGESDAQDTDGTASDNPYRLFADLGAVMERALAVHCDAESVARALNAIERDLALAPRPCIRTTTLRPSTRSSPRSGRPGISSRSPASCCVAATQGTNRADPCIATTIRIVTTGGTWRIPWATLRVRSVGSPSISSACHRRDGRTESSPRR